MTFEPRPGGLIAEEWRESQHRDKHGYRNGGGKGLGRQQVLPGGKFGLRGEPAPLFHEFGLFPIGSG